ncbi:hypothetical protein BLX87_03835, partial [Bacillus sp. VT-16-64]
KEEIIILFFFFIYRGKNGFVVEIEYFGSMTSETRKVIEREKRRELGKIRHQIFFGVWFGSPFGNFLKKKTKKKKKGGNKYPRSGKKDNTQRFCFFFF